MLLFGCTEQSSSLCGMANMNAMVVAVVCAAVVVAACHRVLNDSPGRIFENGADVLACVVSVVLMLFVHVTSE